MELSGDRADLIATLTSLDRLVNPDRKLTPGEKSPTEQRSTPTPVVEPFTENSVPRSPSRANREVPRKPVRMGTREYEMDEIKISQAS